MNGLHRCHHHLSLINIGQTHVDIQNVCPCVYLGQGLTQHIVHISPAQGFLHQLFARGIDALTDDAHSVNGHHFGGAAHRWRHVAGHLAHLGLAERLPQQPDILRCGAAAAAKYLYPHLSQGGQTLGKLLRGDVITRAIRVGQPCIGLEHDGKIGPSN